MEITVKESTIVHPAQDTPKGSLWNSNLDLLTTRYHIPTVYYYKPNGSSNFFDPGKLKEALSKILVPFYPIAGRLGLDQNGRLEIICNAEGVLFIEAESTSVMDQFVGDFTDNSEVSRLVPTVDYSEGISSYPLLVLQVTTFKCGGISLGVGLQHTLADGTAALHFINSWADTARGLSPTIAPFMDRTLLRARVSPTPTFHHVEYDPPPKIMTTGHSILTSESQSNDLKPSIVSLFKLTVDQLNILKAKPNIGNSDSIKYSTYSILTSHLWRCISKARGLSNDQATKLYIPTDGRFRLNPPLPRGYFGNATFQATAIARAGDLLSEPFTNTVKRIHELLKQVNDEYLRSAIDYIEKVPDLNTLVRGSHTFRCPNLSVISWMWLPIYDADFGWGRPIYMRPANVVQEGKLFVLPSPTSDGSLSLITRLETSHMKLFGKLLYEF
ncbi:shikimate O-hydroxycinnamoyltransferase-like [Durio zibethinus]|uniref:Shikimate O-hydroxycinnamoyltransferase-like n=1 Tax=Durio zibethinus TaxID=66656 RepID=A0A6P5X1X3_DURZI|nr:shikimate O-hydroxycinnamoyltransferase-like [Durio zibethinus]